MGRELIGGLRGWIEWIVEKSGREGIRELARTGEGIKRLVREEQ